MKATIALACILALLAVAPAAEAEAPNPPTDDCVAVGYFLEPPYVYLRPECLVPPAQPGPPL